MIEENGGSNRDKSQPAGQTSSINQSIAGQTYMSNSNLSTLAEVSLAAAGHFYEPNLNHQISQARANLRPSNEDSSCLTHKTNTSGCLSKAQDDPLPIIALPQSVKDAIMATAKAGDDTACAQGFCSSAYDQGTFSR